MNISTSPMIWKPGCDLKLNSYRWIIITIFGLYTGINFFQFMQFTIIANVVQKAITALSLLGIICASLIDRRFYKVESVYVDMSGLVFMGSYILFFIPIGNLIEKKSLKTTSIICSGLTALANCLKMLATSPDKYYIVLITQSMCGLAQSFMLMIPTKVACTWFGAEEVSTACSIGIFGAHIGLALGSTLPTLIVNDSENEEIIRQGLHTMFLYNAIASVAIFVVVVIFFRSKPPSPPSKSQAKLISRNDEEKMTYWLALKGFAKNKDFIIVLCTLANGFGSWNAFGILVNQMFTYSFPNESNRLAGLLNSAALIAGGCFGTVIFGYLLDKTHKFKWISLFTLGVNTLVTLIRAVFMLTSNKIGTCIILPINGFFSGSLMIIAYEYAAETTYPTPEAFGASILNVVIYLFATLYTIALSIIFESSGYLVGYIVIVITLAIGTIPMMFISNKSAKRWNANMKTSFSN